MFPELFEGVTNTLKDISFRPSLTSFLIGIAAAGLAVELVNIRLANDERISRNLIPILPFVPTRTIITLPDTDSQETEGFRIRRLIPLLIVGKNVIGLTRHGVMARKIDTCFDERPDELTKDAGEYAWDQLIQGIVSGRLTNVDLWDFQETADNNTQPEATDDV
jgi:hypothetical protein